ncbi:MAG: nitroreductase family protein [Mediterranea sp.]|jgi:nitroreductase|nr:nitroreductase family protein [Mediterranea sp.]
MIDLNELIKRRHSTRRFTDKELTQEEVVTLLKAGLMAPSSKGKTPWQFVVVDEKQTLDILAHCKEHGAAFIAEAPLAIVVAADPSVSEAWVEDASIAAIMIQLQAEDLGLGSCWSQIHERTTPAGTLASDFIRALLDIPSPLEVLCVIAVGHKGAERKPFDEEQLKWEKVHINKYGGKE